MVEEFLTRLDMVLTYQDYARQREHVASLIARLKAEVEMNRQLANALKTK